MILKLSEESDLKFLFDEDIMESIEEGFEGKLMEGVEPCISEADFFEFQILNNKTQVTPRWDVILEKFQDYPPGTFRNLFHRYMMNDKFKMIFQFPYIDPENRAQKSDVSL